MIGDLGSCISCDILEKCKCFISKDTGSFDSNRDENVGCIQGLICSHFQQNPAPDVASDLYAGAVESQTIVSQAKG